MNKRKHGRKQRAMARKLSRSNHNLPKRTPACRINEKAPGEVLRVCASSPAHSASPVLSEADPTKVRRRFPTLLRASLRLLQSALSDTRKGILPRNGRASLLDQERAMSCVQAFCAANP